MNRRFKEIHSQWGVWNDIDEDLYACHVCAGVDDNGVGYHVVDDDWTCMRCKQDAPHDVVDVFELLLVKKGTGTQI